MPQLKPASSTDTASTSSELTADNAPPTRVESVLKAADLSPEAVTSPLEALALACVAEKATSEEAQEQQSTEFTSNDVLCGRGGLTNNAPGNIFFRKLVRMKQQVYLLASKREKAGVAREIVETIRSLSPPGRFLKKDSNGVYMDIGDRKAREKTSQALREGAPNIRQGLGGSTCTTIPVGVAAPTTTMTLEESTYMIGQLLLLQHPSFINLASSSSLIHGCLRIVQESFRMTRLAFKLADGGSTRRPCSSYCCRIQAQSGLFS